MEENKNNKGLIWLILILIILVLGLVGYIVYDKVILNDKNTELNNKVSEVEKHEEKEIMVVDATSFTSNYYKDDTIKMTIPKIINGGEKTIDLNKQILDTILSEMVVPNDSDDNSGNPKELKTSYKYFIKNNIIGIIISTIKKPWNASGTGEFAYSFFYDIENDKILTKYDAIKKMGFSDKEILEKVVTCDPYPESPNDEESCTIEKIKELFDKNYINPNVIDEKLIIGWN